jgi:plasmid stabilization system protein ParE
MGSLQVRTLSQACEGTRPDVEDADADALLRDGERQRFTRPRQASVEARLAQLSLSDRDGIFTHIQKPKNPRVAVDVGQQIVYAARCLLDIQEGRATPGRIAGTRELVVWRTPYIAVYA